MPRPCSIPASRSRRRSGHVDVALQRSPGGSEGHRLTVNDDGPGIPEEELPLLFGRFYRGAASSRRAGDPGGDIGGSGLGLAIVREIVERHGGVVRAESRSPRGLAITVEIPALARERTQA